MTTGAGGGGGGGSVGGFVVVLVDFAVGVIVVAPGNVGVECGDKVGDTRREHLENPFFLNFSMISFIFA